MIKQTAIKLFNENTICIQWDKNQEKSYFSIVDVVPDHTESVIANNYRKVLKNRLKLVGNQLIKNCCQGKMQSSKGKFCSKVVPDTKQLFRLIQTILSPKVEPFKLWLAKMGRARLDEIEDSEIGIERLFETCLRKVWINQRLKSIEIRKELTDEKENRNVKKGQEYPILTDEIAKGWSGFSTNQYKTHKDLEKNNLRDRMTNLELVLNMFAEASTNELSNGKKSKTFFENKNRTQKAGIIAKAARLKLENITGKKVITKNYIKQGQNLELNDGRTEIINNEMTTRKYKCNCLVKKCLELIALISLLPVCLFRLRIRPTMVTDQHYR